MSTPAGEIETHQRVDRVRGRLEDVDEALVRAHLELLAESLFTCGERMTQYMLRSVGSGIGPETLAPVFWAVSTMSLVD